MTDIHRPKISILSESLIKSIHGEALKALEQVGVFVENEEAVRLLQEAGMIVDKQSRRVFMKEELVARCVESAPRKIELFDVFEKPKVRLEGDLVHYDPGSAALNILDGDEIRKPLTGDFVKFSRLVDTLQNIDAQSTALICSDVPEEIQDRYRLYIALHFCSKPVVTGTFREDAFADMKEMLIAIRGDAERLRHYPLAIFDACPSPPMKWSQLTCQSVIDAARSGIPSEFISMPLSGATGPVTLAGTLVQHTAETLSGVVISQLAQKGAPVIFGGSPSIFDMKKGTTPMGAIETMMIDSSYAQIGKFLGLPVHAYMGLSDAKRFDYQSGMESGIGIILAALAGVNMVSGAGMLDFESCQSLEKLVVDNETIGMAKRLIAGITQKSDPMALDILMDVIGKGENFLSHPSTLKHFRSEFYRPGPVIDRANLGEWERNKKDIRTRAREVIEAALCKDNAYRLEEEKSRRLREIMERAAKRFGMEKLPELEPERVGAR
jgi:trimethylamine---corrinoid protein Co-methyltransferase